MFIKNAKIVVSEEDLCKMAEEFLNHRIVSDEHVRVTSFAVDHSAGGGGYRPDPAYTFTTAKKDEPGA